MCSVRGSQKSMEELSFSGKVGVIPDGNRRWARKNRIPLSDAYWITMRKIAMTVETLFRLGASSVSVYLLSKDNLGRSRNDLQAVLEAEQRLLTDLLPRIKDELGLKVFHAGDQEALPPSFVRGLSLICDTDQFPRNVVPSLFLCAAYDPLDEVVTCLLSQNDVCVENFWVPHKIDLVIRTGGDQRLSGFLPLQCSYAEFFFEPYYFPEIDEERLGKVISDFCRSRERRFGR